MPQESSVGSTVIYWSLTLFVDVLYLIHFTQDVFVTITLFATVKDTLPCHAIHNLT